MSLVLSAITGANLALPTKDGGALAPIIPPPTPAPVYVPVGDPVPPNPVTDTPPPDQTRGTGGTIFAVTAGIIAPPVYRPMIIPTFQPPELYPSPTPDGYYPNAPAVPQIIAPAKPGTRANVMPPPVPPPAKQPVPANATPTEMPGPIKGTVAGFDLTRVPLWAWLVGAALLGARLFK